MYVWLLFCIPLFQFAADRFKHCFHLVKVTYFKIFSFLTFILIFFFVTNYFFFFFLLCFYVLVMNPVHFFFSPSLSFRIYLTHAGGRWLSFRLAIHINILYVYVRPSVYIISLFFLLFAGCFRSRSCWVARFVRFFRCSFACICICIWKRKKKTLYPVRQFGSVYFFCHFFL